MAMVECGYCGKTIWLVDSVPHGPLFCDGACALAKAEEEKCEIDALDFVEHDFT